MLGDIPPYGSRDLTSENEIEMARANLSSLLTQNISSDMTKIFNLSVLQNMTESGIKSCY